MKLNKNLDYKKRALLSLVLTTIVLLSIVYFFVFSYLDKVEEANHSLSNHRIEFETRLIKEEKISKIDKNLTDIAPDVKSIEKTFIDENNKLEFITMLEGLADKNLVNLEIKIDFNKIDPKNKSNYLNLNLLGSYSNLMNFLVSIENLDYYINVNNINLSSPINNSGSVAGVPSDTRNLTMNIGALTYWK